MLLMSGNLGFSTPSDDNTYIAGGDIGVTIYSDPEGEFQVQLECNGSGLSVPQSGFITNTLTEFSIPSTAYGETCNLQIVNYDTNTYQTPSAVPMSVSLPVSFAYPSQGQSFTSPNGTYPLFKLTSTAILGNEFLTMTQNCGEGNVYVYSGVAVDNEYFLQNTPNNFVGTCVLSTAATSNYAASTPDITINFTTNSLAITQPISNAPIYADKVTGFTIAANPTTNQPFTVEFIPTEQQTSNVVVSGIRATPDYPVRIPRNLYGYYFLSLINYPLIYPAPAPTFLYVVQQLKLDSPKSGTVLDPYAPIPFLVGANSNTMNVLTTLTLKCDSPNEANFNVETNVVFDYFNPSGLIGSCVASYLPSPKPYLLAFEPVSFTLGILLAFASVPFQVVNGQLFKIFIKSLNTSSVATGVDLQISCGGGPQVFFSVAINTLVTLNLNMALTGLGPYACTISNIPDVLFNQIYASTTLLIPLDQAQKSAIAKSFFIPL